MLPAIITRGVAWGSSLSRCSSVSSSTQWEQERPLLHRPSQRLGEAWPLDLKPVFDVGDLVTMPGDPWGPERQPSPRRDGVMAFTAVGAHALLPPDLRSGCQGALWQGEGSGPRF